MAETMKADQAVFLLQNVYMGPLKNESRTTKKILEAVPADKGEYRPEPAARSAIELVRHIAAADNRFVETVINGVFDTSPAMIPENVKTPAEIAAWYEQRFAKNYEALTKISAGVFTLSGIIAGLVSNTPLITVSTKRLSAAAMWRASSIALLAAGSGRYPPLSAGTASRIFFVVRLSFFIGPMYTF